MIDELINELSLKQIVIEEGLRKAKLISKQINDKNFEEWISLELYGYKKNRNVLPPYRVIRCDTFVCRRILGLSKKINVKSIESMKEIDKEVEKFFTESKIIAGIPTIQSLYLSGKPSIQMDDQTEDIDTNEFPLNKEFGNFLISGKIVREVKREDLKILLDDVRDELINYLKKVVYNKNNSEKLESFFKNQIKPKSIATTNTSGRTKKTLMDIGIITMVTAEINAVTDFFNDNNTYKTEKRKKSSRVYHCGKIETNDNKHLNIVAIQTRMQGNRSVISAYNALIKEFNPKILVLLGIAGSIHKDADICDVVICESIYYYDRRAETEKGIMHRLEVFKISPWTIDLIQCFQNQKRNEEPLLDAAPNSPNEKFKVLFGPLATGEAVVKFKDAEVRKWLASVNDKILAIETEAGGFASQFYEDENNRGLKAKGILIIRGISDKADVEKNNLWRLAASKNAMTTLVEILKANFINL